MEPLAGIADADALLGRPFPLPRCALPLARWVEVQAGDDGVQVAWNFDDSRPGSPGRLVLLVGPPGGSVATQLPDRPPEPFGCCERRRSPLPEAQPSLRPVVELRWRTGEHTLRLTAQGPWSDADLRTIVDAVVV